MAAFRALLPSVPPAPNSQSPIGFFDQQVLASYRNEPDKWVIENDYFEGRVRSRLEASDLLDVRFGYRALENGDLAIAAWLPDLWKTTPHLRRWEAFRQVDPKWATTDARYDLWVRRYLGGDWDVENGPRMKLAELVEYVRAVTDEATGIPLLSAPLPEDLAFPSAQNTYAYACAHADLYRCLIDGIDKECLRRLAAIRQITVGLESSKTVAGLLTVLPELRDSSEFTSAYEKTSAQRRNASHGIKGKAVRSAAFESFSQDLEQWVAAFASLLRILESVLCQTGIEAKERLEAQRSLPRITNPPEPHYSVNQAVRMIGKTVERVDVGLREDRPGIHRSEVMLLHFADGSTLGVETGSNARNLSNLFKSMSPQDFHVDLQLQWVPAPAKRGSG